jgi:hypothetical protein
LDISFLKGRKEGRREGGKEGRKEERKEEKKEGRKKKKEKKQKINVIKGMEFIVAFSQLPKCGYKANVHSFIH